MDFVDWNVVVYITYLKVVDTVLDEIPIRKLEDGSLNKTKVRLVKNCLGNKMFSERLDSTWLLVR